MRRNSGALWSVFGVSRRVRPRLGVLILQEMSMCAYMTDLPLPLKDGGDLMLRAERAERGGEWTGGSGFLAAEVSAAAHSPFLFL